MSKCMKKNHIHCSVSQCMHNIVADNECGLDEVNIGTHEANPSECECTDCNSFVLR